MWKKPGSETASLSSLLLLVLATQPGPAAAVLKCDPLVVDGRNYNLHALAGPHTVVTHEYVRPTYHNTTYTIDVCAPLRRKDDVPKEQRCPDGTRVCAIKHRWDPQSKKSETDQVIPIVVGHDGKPFAWEAKILSADEDPEKKDAQKEGLRLIMSGNSYQQRAQRTVVDFRCDPNLEGTEKEWESIDEYLPADGKKAEKRKNSRRDEKGDSGDGDDDDDASTPERQLKKDGAALVWNGYRRDKDDNGKDTDTLYLTWYTKHVCDAALEEPAAEAKHWGFFTWLVIIAFLAVASYLIFGSWLNYNRYGARGWDLLPHGDTIRDVPYLLKDWTRRVLNTVQGSGSRGGYSAV